MEANKKGITHYQPSFRSIVEYIIYFLTYVNSDNPFLRLFISYATLLLWLETIIPHSISHSVPSSKSLY